MKPNNFCPENYIGNTPIIKLKNVDPKGASVFVKLEEHNYGGSIKARPAFQMIIDAENQGVLTPGSTLIEATGGNTGIALAMIGLRRGYRVLLVIPDNFSATKIKACQAVGAETVLSDSTLGRDSHVRLTAKLLADNPNYVNLDQFGIKRLFGDYSA